MTERRLDTLGMFDATAGAARAGRGGGGGRRRRRRPARPRRHRERRRARHGRQRHRRRRARRRRRAVHARAGRRVQGLRAAGVRRRRARSCFAVSFSGDTEETVEAASTAAVAGARMVVRRQGGELGRAGRRRGARRACRLPDDIPHAAGRPRRAGHPAAGRARGDRPVPGRQRLDRRRPSTSSSAAATSWSRDGNPARDAGPPHRPHDPARSTAAARSAPSPRCAGRPRSTRTPRRPRSPTRIPELCHNEICGWGQHGDVTRQVFTLVQPAPRPRAPAGRPAASTWCATSIDEVVAGDRGGAGRGRGRAGPAARPRSSFGDFMSLHLAFQEGVDPGPIPVLDADEGRPRPSARR